MNCVKFIIVVFLLHVSMNFKIFAFTSDSIKMKEQDEIWLPFPSSESENVIGTGYDINMKKIGKVYDLMPETRSQDRYYLVREQINNHFLLTANGGFLSHSGNVSKETNKRYIILRVYYLTSTKSIHPTEITPIKLPAQIFAQAIHYGYMFEIVIEGEDDKLDANIASSIIAGSLDIGTAKAKYKLRTTVKSYGLKAKNEKSPVIADSETAIKENFEFSGKPQPIFIVYKVLKEFVSPKINFKEFKIHQNTTYKISNISISIGSKKNNGNNWDSFLQGAEPDLLVKVHKASPTAWNELGSTLTRKGVFAANWETDISFYLDANDWLVLEVVDDDVDGDDVVGKIAIEMKDLIDKSFGEEITIGTRLDNSGVGTINSAKIIIKPVN